MRSRLLRRLFLVLFLIDIPIEVLIFFLIPLFGFPIGLLVLLFALAFFPFAVVLLLLILLVLLLSFGKLLRTVVG